MATYQDIRGLRVKYVSADPSNTATGEVWYNSTTGTLRSRILSEAWASAAPIITARRNLGASASSTQTAGIIFGGTPGTPVVGLTEEYDGSGWTAGGAMNTPRRDFGGAGIQTAALAFGGTSSAPGTETYNGTSWTSVNDLNTARNSLGGAGLQGAALAFGGSAPPSKNETESWNGTSWTTSPLTLTAGRAGLGGLGTQTAALAVDGGSPGNATEEFDGEAWTAAATTTTTRPEGTGEAGTQTAGLVYGGAPAIAATEGYDGSAWSAKPSMGTGRGEIGFGGTQTAALAAGGSPPSPAPLAVTEEFTSSGSVITAGAWASGTVYPAAIQDPAGAGPATAAIVYGGYTTAPTNISTEYDGSAWTATPTLNTPRVLYQTGIGTQTAALAASGTPPPTGATEKWDGSSWTSVTSMNDARSGGTAGGVQTSALMVGGSIPTPTPPSSTDKVESYNGSTWTVETVAPSVQFGGRGFSGQSETSNILIGVNAPGSDTYSYNGSAWTDLGHSLVEGKTTNTGGSQQGTATAAIIAGGFSPAPAIVNTSQQYNGTAWATAPSLGTARRGGAAAGSASSCLAVGGEEPARSNKTEEFTAETSAVNIETLTTS